MFCTPKFSGSAVHVKKTCTTYHKSHLNGSRRVVAGLTLRPKFPNFVQILCSIFAFQMDGSRIWDVLLLIWLTAKISKFRPNFVQSWPSKSCKWIGTCLCRSDTMTTLSKFCPQFVKTLFKFCLILSKFLGPTELVGVQVHLQYMAVKQPCFTWSKWNMH